MDYYQTIIDFFQTHQALFIICCVLSVLVCVLGIVAMWILFKKMGEKGWKAIVPFYNLFTLFKLVWNKKSFWEVIIFTICMVVLEILLILFGKQSDFFGIILFIGFALCSIWILVDFIVLYAQTAYAFGKSGWFAVGLVFLSVIFLFILAFGQSKYVGNPTEKQE